MAPKAADCKNVHNPNLQCKNDFLPYFDGFFLSLLKVYDHKIIFSWPLCIFGSKITKKNVSLIFYPKIPNPPPLRPLWYGDPYKRSGTVWSINWTEGHNWKSGLPREGFSLRKSCGKHSSNADSVSSRHSIHTNVKVQVTQLSSKRTNFKGRVLQLQCCSHTWFRLKRPSTGMCNVKWNLRKLIWI